MKLNDEDLTGLRNRLAVWQRAVDDVRRFQMTEEMLHEAYILFTRALGEKNGLPPRFDVDMATGEVLPAEEEVLTSG